jgi:hypothetical protein
LSGIYSTVLQLNNLLFAENSNCVTKNAYKKKQVSSFHAPSEGNSQNKAVCLPTEVGRTGNGG